MSHFPVDPDPYRGPSSTGKWATHIPELSGFSGTIAGITGRFWKSRREIADILGHGEWGYDRQLGLWVEDFKPLVLQ